MKQPILRTSSIEIETFVDKDTGETLGSNQKKHTYIANSKEQFFIVYSTLIGVFNNLSHGSGKVYHYMLLHYKSEAPIEIGKPTRQLMSDYCKISMGTVANSLTELKEKNLIYSPHKRVYYINPRYAFQGNTTSRNQALKVIIELGCKDC